jgi:energy-coupling factor transporter ATP-binding protein EcfA2
MPLPLIPIFIALVIGASGATVVCKWDDIANALQGKNIAVLGARGVGKTTLLKYMEKGILIEKYIQTVDRAEIERTRIKIGDLDIRLNKTDDISGDAATYSKWKNLFDKSDLVFYIVRTDMLLKKDSLTEKRSEDDLKQIQGWIKESKTKKQFFIIGNHWSSDPIFKNLTDDQIGNYVDQFRALPVVKKMTLLAGGVSTVKVALGSLATQKDADNLILTIFRQVDK